MVSNPLSAHGPEVVAVRDGVTGTVVESLEPGAFAKALAVLESRPDYAAELGRNARTLAGTDYNIRSMQTVFYRAVLYALGGDYSGKV